MAFSFDRRNQENPNQAVVDENRARMAQESRIISDVIDHLLKGASVDEASSQVEGATVEQVNAWIKEGRITDPKYLNRPYRATDQDLH
jgi:hypothetical protein